MKTDDIAYFYNLWPTEAASKILNYSLETVHTHEDNQLPRRLTQCLDAFVDPDKTKASKRCQTVKVVGGAGDENPQKKPGKHVRYTGFYQSQPGCLRSLQQCTYEG